MTVYALPTGRIFGEILTKPTKNGGQVTFFKMKVTNGNATEFWSISTFSDTVREELSGLSDGDAISVVGALTTELFDWRGEKRVSHKIRADRALALKQRPAKPRATPARQAEASNTGGRALAAASWASPVREAEVETPRGNAPFMPDSDIPFMCEWR
jgi:single-stranded DNA-binding protein